MFIKAKHKGMGGDVLGGKGRDGGRSGTAQGFKGEDEEIAMVTVNDSTALRETILNPALDLPCNIHCHSHSVPLHSSTVVPHRVLTDSFARQNASICCKRMESPFDFAWGRISPFSS